MALARAKYRAYLDLERRKYTLDELHEMAAMPGLFDVEGTPIDAGETSTVGVLCPLAIQIHGHVTVSLMLASHGGYSRSARERRKRAAVLSQQMRNGDADACFSSPTASARIARHRETGVGRALGEGEPRPPCEAALRARSGGAATSCTRSSHSSVTSALRIRSDLQQ
jgi:hypothetical protein